MFCSNCGKEMEENAKFCSNCGKENVKVISEDKVVKKQKKEKKLDKKKIIIGNIKIKKLLIIIAVIIGILICFYIKEATMTTLQRINKAKTFDEIVVFGNRFSDLSTEEEQALSNKAKEYMIDGYKINGIYYYNEYFVPGTGGEKSYGEHLNEKVVIYMNNEKEIYVVPMGNDKNINNDNLGEILNLENIDNYKYSIDNWEAYDSSWNSGYSHITLDVTNVKNKCSLNLCYAKDNFFVEIYGDTPNNKDKSLNNRENMPFSGKYYNDEKKSLEIAKADYEKLHGKITENRVKNSQLKHSIPKIGMTSSEVERTKWGIPYKINKSTYSWGTTEQWVYDDYGYVYFENGIVTSISESY